MCLQTETEFGLRHISYAWTNKKIWIFLSTRQCQQRPIACACWGRRWSWNYFLRPASTLLMPSSLKRFFLLLLRSHLEYWSKLHNDRGLFARVIEAPPLLSIPPQFAVGCVLNLRSLPEGVPPLLAATFWIMIRCPPHLYFNGATIVSKRRRNCISLAVATDLHQAIRPRPSTLNCNHRNGRPRFFSVCQRNALRSSCSKCRYRGAERKTPSPTMFRQIAAGAHWPICLYP